MANSKKALDENGVLYLWGKVKTYVATAIANIKLPLVRKPLLPVVTMCTPLTPLRWTRWRARA